VFPHDGSRTHAERKSAYIVIRRLITIRVLHELLYLLYRGCGPRLILSAGSEGCGKTTEQETNG
jgi:hypothetical protein